jgi:hypothetical protein
MCSTSAQRIAEIGQAIDDLAAETRAAQAQAERRDADQVVIKLAQLWEKLAELDPEVARRMPTYEALSAAAFCAPTHVPHMRTRRQAPTISTSRVALTSGCSRTAT